MLLTGTFGQYKALVPSVENGYFSRLLTVVIRGTNPFDKRYVSSKGGQSAVPKIVGQRLLRTYERLMEGGEQEWSLTEAQKERLGEHLETEYGTLIGLLGDNFHSAVVRMAVQIERIAMVLSAMRGDSALTRRAELFIREGKGEESPHEMRGNEHTEGRIPSGIMEEERKRGAANEDGMSGYYPDAKNEIILCRDEDYEAAEIIGNRLLLHMAAAYRMIDGDAQECVPEIKPIDQRKVVFEQLKAEYALGELIQEAKSQGVSRSSAIRWNNEWIEKGMVTKENHGIYRKVA